MLREGRCRAPSTPFPPSHSRFRVSVLETTDVDSVLARRDGLLAACGSVAQGEGDAGLLLFAVDILNEEALFLCDAPELRARVGRAFGVAVPEAPREPLRLPGILSRKKQIVPALEQALGKAE